MSTTTHLVYRLSAALGAMGTLAGNERRGTDDWPARSAITGMLGAALGVQRSDRDSLRSLETEYAIGLSRLRLGSILTDYHTAQTVPTSAAKRPSSRAEALALGRAKGALGTIITQREYHQECMFDVAIRTLAETPRWSLDALLEALERPYYVLYFGRKACPLDLPVSPRLIEADNTTVALEAYRESNALSGSTTFIELLLDPRMIDADSVTGRTIVRRDGVIDRERWTFADRESVLVGGREETSR